jgi:hypothetical protein
LVVGGGHSALTSVLALGELATEAPGTRVIWARRTRKSYPARLDDPLPARCQLEGAANELLQSGADWLTVHDEAEVDQIERRRSGLDVLLCTPDEPISVQVDRMIAANGFRPERELYRELEVHECYASAAPMRLGAVLLAGGGDEAGSAIELLRSPEPNFFIVGAKRYGRAPAFLLGAGRRQVAMVLADLGLEVAVEDEDEVERWTAVGASSAAAPPAGVG